MSKYDFSVFRFNGGIDQAKDQATRVQSENPQSS